MLRKEGKELPVGSCTHRNGFDYPLAIAVALQEQLGDTHRGVKTVMRWTGASERTVKNWFSGARGPSGHHLMFLMHFSDAVLEAVLSLADRPAAITATRLQETRRQLIHVLGGLDELLRALAVGVRSCTRSAEEYPARSTDRVPPADPEAVSPAASNRERVYFRS